MISHLWKRSMGATDMFYRLFWCFTGASSTSASQSTGSQHHSLVVASPSGPASCWLGFLSGSSNQRGTTTRIGNDTAEIPSNPGTSTRLSSQYSLIQSQTLRILHFFCEFLMNFFRISRQIPEKSDAFCFFNQICENKLESCRKF